MKREEAIDTNRARRDGPAACIGKEAALRGACWLAIIVPTCIGSPAYAEGDATAGKTVFANQCASCHTTEVGKNGFGPSLAAVLGRKAGSLPGYKYSPAMVNSGLTWDEKTLDQWLQSPMGDVHGTKMFITVPNAEDRQNVIAYLETLK